MNRVSWSHLIKSPSESKAALKMHHAAPLVFMSFENLLKLHAFCFPGQHQLQCHLLRKSLLTSWLKNFDHHHFNLKGWSFLTTCNLLIHFSTAFSSFTEADISLMKAPGSVKSNFPLDIHAACSSSPACLSLRPYTHLPFPHDQSSSGLTNSSAALLGDVLLPISISHTIHFYISNYWSVMLSSPLHSPLFGSRRKWHSFMEVGKIHWWHKKYFELNFSSFPRTR